MAPKLPVPSSALPAFKAALDAALARLRDRQPAQAAAIVQTLTTRCSEPLAAVRSITTLYRMTNREVCGAGA